MNSPYQLQTIGKWTPEYLQELPSIELDWLDYKASAWLKIEPTTFEVFSKYLSAYANFDGGYLIIGATNPTPGNPLQLDGGVDFTLKNGIQGWLEDKLPNLTDPKLPKIQIQPIPLSPRETKGPLVIYVPPSSEAPHQALDRKFYTRIGSKLQALSTRAVFDIANRQKHPDVSVSVSLNLFHHDDRDNPRSNLLWKVSNNSEVLCLHFGLQIKVPLTYKEGAVVFGDPAYLDQEEGVWFTMLAANNSFRPLFPRATSQGKIPVKSFGGRFQTKNGPRKTLENIKIRVWADGAPFRDFSFPINDVTREISA
jgi:hypothetical protein